MKKLSNYRDCYISDIINYQGEINICGWVNSIRDHGGLAFIDLRDISGVVQIVCPENYKFSFKEESIIKVKGNIRNREESQINLNITTGKIEIEAKEIEIISKSAPLPIEVNNEKISEDLQLKYRTIYLRGEKIQNNLRFRSNFIKYIRDYFSERGFYEYQTPILTASSPEGARDFVIPSRLHHGKFYALPQAPQIFKQLLMASCFDKYFQIAPCFRDEDARKDRCYGEFYQLDAEFSFVEQEDVLHFVSELCRDLILKFNGKESTLDRLSYKDSLEIYATDKPDLRNPLKVEDFSEIFLNSEMDIFKKQVEKGKVVRGIRVPCNFGKTELNNSLCKSILEKIEKQYNFKIAYVMKQDNELKGPIAKFLPLDILEDNSVIFFICDSYGQSCKKLDILRNSLPAYLDFYLDPEEFKLVQIVDFPMFEKDDESPTGWSFTHNPFSKPKQTPEEQMELDKITAYQYDLVLNGFEICSGSIRNTDMDLLIKQFALVGRSESEVRSKFNSIINGFQYGVPPHGGFAIGIERFIMILLKEESVRRIVAFPLNTNGFDPFTGSPNEISSKQKKELKIENITDKLNS